MEKEKLWTKDFVSASIVNFVLMLSMYLLLVIMATYAMETYGASVSLGGLVASIFVIGSLVGRLYAGRQIAKIGSKKMLITGILIFLFLTLFYFIPTNIYLLILLRFLHGIGVGMATTATGTIVAQVIPSSRNGEGIGYFSMSVVLATAIGPLIGVGLIGVLGYTSVFLFSLIMGIGSLVIALPLKVPEMPAPKSNESDGKGFKLSNFFEMRAVPVAFSMFVAAFAYSGILSFITGYAADIDLVEAGSFYFFVYAVVILLSRPFTGPLIDRRGGNSVAYPGLVLFAIGMLIISQANSNWVFLVAAAIIGLGYGNFQSTTQSIAIKVTPPHRMGLATSTYFIALDLGLGVGPFVLGYLVPLSGYRGMYLSLVGLIIVGIIVYYFTHGRKDKELTRAGTAQE